jgi:hypothetical protein|tara:strand:- start:1045 stop:2037 length:993 start_codon:yes stop_codon:yes gene_type:complete
MSKHIIVGVSIAFFVSLTILFTMNFISQDPRTIENINEHPFFLSELDSEKSSIFLIGHSHVGQLNTSKINQIISKNYNNTDIYNLAMYHDTPSSRLGQIDNLINLEPKIIFYGIAIADFLGPCKYSNDCDILVEKEQRLPDPKEIFENLDIPKKIGIEKMNPKFTTLKFIREGFSGNSLFPEQGRRLQLENTPFYVIDDSYTRITSDIILKNSLIESSVNMINKKSIKNSNEIIHLKAIIEKIQENDIKIILFKTPHHQYYIENIPIESIRDYEIILEKISSEMNIEVYDFFSTYKKLPIWVDLEHISYNEKATIYTEDVSKMILKELEP